MDKMSDKYIGGIECTLRDSAKNSLHSEGMRELLLDAADQISLLPALVIQRDLCRALIHQIELGDFTDKHGHKLTNNVHFIKAKEAVGE